MAYSTNLLRAVQVTERGLVYYSDDLVNWIPRESGTNLALRSVAFLDNGRCVMVGEAGGVWYSDDLGSVSAFRRGILEDAPTPNWLEGLAIGGGVCVAVGDSASIYSSPDGIEWTRRASPTPNWLTSVTHGPAGFVAVGELGTILRSQDAVQWTGSSLGSRDWLGVTYGGGVYLAVGREGTIASSTDGETWTLSETGRTNDLWFATIGGPSRVVGGTLELLVSETNGPWVDQFERRPHAAPAGSYYAGIARTNFFLVAGRSGVLAEGYKSADQSTYIWVENEPSVRNRLWESVYLKGLHVAVGDAGTIQTSDDGDRWQLELAPGSVTNRTLLGVGGDTNLLLAVGTDGSIIRSPDGMTNITLTVTTNGTTLLTNVQASTFGIFWYETPSPTTNQLQGVASGHGLYVIVGDNGEILTSTNGLGWSVRESGASELLSSVAVVPSGFVVAGQNGRLLHSAPGGETWNQVSSGTANWLFRVRSRGDLCVAVGENGTVLTSTDPEVWIPRNPGVTEFLTDVTWVGDLFLVVGLNGTWLVTTDFVSWRQLNPFTYRDLYSIQKGRDGILILMGEEGVILRNRLFPDPAPVELLGYSRVVSPGAPEALNLFLLGGRADQRCTLEFTPDLETPDWREGPYLEFRNGPGTLEYVEPESLETTPPRRFFRTRLIVE